MTLLRSLAIGAAAMLAIALSAATAPAGQPLEAPAGRVVLEISGSLAQTNDAGAARFDMAMLDALPQRETVTATPWHEGQQTFRGPLLADLIDRVGAQGRALRIVAINDYAVEMPLSDARDFPVILASRQNGAPMPLRDKGPLFVIYPFDEMPQLFNEVYFARSVWQVKAIEVLE